MGTCQGTIQQMETDAEKNKIFCVNGHSTPKPAFSFPSSKCQVLLSVEAGTGMRLFSHLRSRPTPKLGCLGQVHGRPQHALGNTSWFQPPRDALCVQNPQRRFLLKTEKPQNKTPLTQLGAGPSNKVLSPLSAPFLVLSCNTEVFSGLLSLFADPCLEIQLQSETVSLSLSWLSEEQKIACGENPSAGPHTSLCLDINNSHHH